MSVSGGDSQFGHAPIGAIPVGDLLDEVVASSSLVPAGIASAEAFGTAKLTLFVLPSGIASAEAFGTPLESKTVAPTAIASAEAFGSPELNKVAAPSGIASAEAFGTATVAGPIIASGIASGAAFGTLTVVVPQIVGGSGIASAEAFGTATVAGPIIGQGIPTGLAFGVPSLAGPIQPDGIASAEAFGSLALNIQQLVKPGAIASAEAFGSGSVHMVKLIVPSGIASAEDFGTARVKGSAQFVVQAGGIAPGLAGVPTVVGGTQAIELFIGGVNRSKYMRWATAQVQSQTIGRWTATFDLVDTKGAYAPQIGQTVIISDGGRKLFAGCLIEYKLDRAMGSERTLTFHCTATDKSGLCDRRRVSDSYTADMDGADVVLKAAAAFLNGEGITTGGVPASLGTLGADIPATYQTVTQLFDRVADLTATVWWIDVNGVLIFSTLANLPTAPFSITETSKNYRVHSVGRSMRDYRNVQYVRSNLTLVPEALAAGQGGATVSTTETFTLPQADAVARGFLFGALITRLPILQLVSLKVNGVEQTPFTLTDQTYGQAPQDLSFLWWAFAGQNYVTPPTQGATLNTGDTVVVVYTPWIPSVAAPPANTPLQPSSVPGLPGLDGSFGTCGSGRVEALDQITDISIREEAQAIGDALLAKFSTIPDTLTVETDLPGLFVGMKLPVDLPNLYVPSTTMMITGMSGTCKGPDLGHKSTFRWQVDATTQADPGNTVKWFERLWRRSDLPLPVDRFESATMILAPGTSLGAGTLDSNKKIVQHTGQIFEAVAVATGAPLDQDLLLDALIDGVSVFGTSPLVIPAGSTSLVRSTKFALPVLFAFRNQTILPVASYRVTGPSPKAARSVTFELRWSY